ncbi:hypothetical protein CHU98_g3027 [Xylaria longipes]|nr:hypothetical protein CHU98_g3027 [Xylaria longipes]
MAHSARAEEDEVSIIGWVEDLDGHKPRIQPPRQSAQVWYLNGWTRAGYLLRYLGTLLYFEVEEGSVKPTHSPHSTTTTACGPANYSHPTSKVLESCSCSSAPSPIYTYECAYAESARCSLPTTSGSAPSVASPVTPPANRHRGYTTAPPPKMMEDGAFYAPYALLNDSFNSSNSTQVGDASSRWDPSWFGEECDTLDLDNLDASSLQTNDLPSDGLQRIPHTPHDGVSQKGHTSSHGFAASHQEHYLNVPHTSDENTPWAPFPHRHNAENTILEDSERPLAFKGLSTYGCPDFFFEPQHMPDYLDNFRGGNDISTQPPLCFDHFAAENLCKLPQTQDADDTASQASCDSECTSSVCDNENCSVTGIPCDDPACVDNITPTQVPGLTTQLPTQVAFATAPFHQSHSQPCNHTESEHQVAKTLGELHTQEKIPFPFHYGSPVSRNRGQFCDRSYESYVSSPPQLTTEIESSGPRDSQIPLQSTPSLPRTPNGASQPGKLLCRWTTNTDADPGGGEICGVTFTNTKDFHDHLCEFHIGKLTSQTGQAVHLWNMPSGLFRKPGPSTAREDTYRTQTIPMYRRGLHHGVQAKKCFEYVSPSHH